jgi:4-hydroxybenzoate polyprenyltransferase
MSGSGTAPREGQTFAGTSPLVVWANFVKLPHTVFALPFAIVGVVIASYEAPVTLAQVGWVVLAFTAARFAAMGFNRIADRAIDARNPRTAMREIPVGALSVPSASLAVAVASVVFVLAAWRLNPLCLLLSPIALGWVLCYSYTKRFTAWSHVVLGWGLGIAPVGGYLAVTGAWSAPWWGLVALAAGVMAWVAGFDVLYAMQDLEFDRAQGLNSIPARFGVRGALWASRVLHLLAVLALSAAGVALLQTTGWALALAMMTVLLLWEHRLVWHGDLAKLDAAFFAMNGRISLLFGSILVVERVLR